MKNFLSISKQTKRRRQQLMSLFVSTILLTTSCQDLSNINKNPDQLSASDINVKYVLTSVLSNSTYEYLYNYAYPGGATLSEAMQYLQRDYIDFQGPNTFIWSPVSFNGPYSMVKNSQYIFDNAQSEAKEDNKKFYTAVGQIMRSFWYGYITSLYGDIPYSEAMQAEKGNFMPVYDKQKDIFKAVLDDLKSANDLLAQVTSVEGAGESDIMYRGDAMKWRKFANSLRLRYLLRLSEKVADMNSSGVDVVAQFKEILGNSSSYPIFTSNSDNAAISFLGMAAANSWYGGPLRYSNRSEFYRRKPCATFVDAMREGMDPRLTTFIRPVDVQLKVSSATPTYQKLADGQIIRNVAATAGINTYRYVGLPPALQDPNLYNLSSSLDFNAVKALTPTVYTDLASNPSVSYLANIYAENANPLVKAVFMGYSELNFILAEAHLRGWITNATAVEYYQAAVLTSMRQYNITDGSLKVYDPASDALVAWNESAFLANLASKYTAANDTEKMTQLMTQKWIASFMTPEFWFDWRRTGLPNLGAKLVLGSNGEKIPVRMIYPTEEKNLNSKNAAAAVSGMEPGEDTQWSKMWLLQGTNKPW